MKNAVVAAVAIALIVGISVVGVNGTVTDHTPPHPDQWDARVLPIVQFDELHRGLTFKHPVQVDFLSADDYSKRVRSAPGDQTDDEKKDQKAFEGELRALGLAGRNLDVLSAANDLNDSGTLAFYDPATQRVSVRGTDMTPQMRVTLAHELTHALQDQYFDISDRRTEGFKTDGEREAFRALIEGDATRVEDEYIRSLSQDEQGQYEQANVSSVDTARNALDQVPQALQALQQAAYVVGPPFVEMLAAKGGNKAVDGATRNPPTTEEQLFDPRAFFANDGAKPASKSALTFAIDDPIDDGDLGVTTWYLMLAERVDPLQALAAVDGWGGDGYNAYEENGSTCMRLNFKGDTPNDETEMRDAIEGWEQSAATQGAVSGMVDDANGLTVDFCDVGVAPTNRSLDAMEFVGLRSLEMAAAMRDAKFDVDKAFAFGDCVVHRLGFSWVQDIDKTQGPDSVSQTLIDQRTQAERACL